MTKKDPVHSVILMFLRPPDFPRYYDVFSMKGHSHVMYHLKFKNGEEEEGRRK